MPFLIFFISSSYSPIGLGVIQRCTNVFNTIFPQKSGKEVGRNKLWAIICGKDKWQSPAGNRCDQYVNEELGGD